MVSFGEFARRKRIAADIGLREASRQLRIAASYLSEIEAGQERPPSVEIIQRMAELYKVKVEELLRHARQRQVEYTAQVLADDAELQLLFRVVKDMEQDEVLDLIRQLLTKRGKSEEQIQELLRKASSRNLPRMGGGGRDGLFASGIVPRYLSKDDLERIAGGFLLRHGSSPSTYAPPTPIESLIEREPNIVYRISKSLRNSASGDPVELGFSRWCPADLSRAEIHINAALAESGRESDVYRLRFTAAHELFHVLEHLPRVALERRDKKKCAREIGLPVLATSVASKAVRSWIKRDRGPRRFQTHEDWREWQANHFAACVLMPAWSVRHNFSQRHGERPIECATPREAKEAAFAKATEVVGHARRIFVPLHEEYEVSAQAMAIRILGLGMVTVVGER